MELSTVLERLKGLQPALSAAGVSVLYVFGSVARGEASSRSDVDLAVEFNRPIGLFEYAGLKRQLEDTLGCRVDLVMPSGLRSEVRDRIMKDAVRAA